MDAATSPAEAGPGRGEPLPGTRAGDAALASLVLLLGVQEVVSFVSFGMAGFVGELAGPAQVLVGVLLAVAQAGTALLRRFRPDGAYLLLAAVTAAQLALVGPFGIYAWAIMAFSVARAPRRTPAGRSVRAVVLRVLCSLPVRLGGPLLAAVLAVVLVRSGSGPEAATRIGAAVGAALNAVPLVLVGAVAGRWTRTAARRAEQEQLAVERLRRSAALETERARIAGEVASGVLAGLRRLVDQAARVGAAAPAEVGEPELRRLREQARTVLAAMRRVLGVLRAPTGDEPGTDDARTDDAGTDDPGTDDAVGAPGPGPAGRAARTRLPAPDRVGLVTLASFLLVALPSATLSLHPIGQPVVDRFLEMLRLPVGSPLALVVVAAQFAAVAWWRTAPVPAVLVSGVGSLLAGLLGGSNLFAEATWGLLVWGAASRAPVVVSGVAVAVSTLVVLAGGLLFNPWDLHGDGLQVGLSFLAVVPLWVAGVLVRRHRSATERRRRDRADAEHRDAVAQERLRVARDLHDVVAHHVSAVAVQAGAARMATDPRLRAEALGHVAEAGRRVAAALPELAGTTPDPQDVVLDAEGLAHLTGPSRQAGLPVRTEVVGAPAGQPGDAELFAQRILTEALTNVLRHAGPSPTRVRVEHGPSTVRVEVVDDGPVPGHHAERAGSGLGTVGMRERVALLGGELRAGPGDGAGWAVRAVLPRTPLLPADEAGPVPISSAPPTQEGPSPA